jgi:large subunit ribosomal protein L22
VSAVESRPEVRAQAKWLRISPRKARLVAEHLGGRSVLEARSVLAFSERAAAREISKVLESAVANAGIKHNLGAEDLVVLSAYVDEGPTLKRFRPRARGRVGRIMKRTCHVTVRLAAAQRSGRGEQAGRAPGRRRKTPEQAEEAST